jgi:hypothetical protein
VPSKRHRLGRGRVDILSDVQHAHLSTGSYLLAHHPHEEFVDEAHRRAAWRMHREAILEAWDRPGQRPIALWAYDLGLKRRPWPQEWSWPAPIRTESEMVHRLLKAGEIEGCKFDGNNRIGSEIVAIEEGWLRWVEIGRSSYRYDHEGCLEVDFGVPKSFARRHLRLAARVLE